MTQHTMKAVVNPRYGPPEDLRLREIPRPRVGPDHVLVRVRAASVNPFDWHLIRGKPYFVRLITGLRGPGNGIPGVDVAGTVEQVGDNVKEFRAGDDVFGSASSTFAEFTIGNEDDFVLKPKHLSFEEAGSLAGAGVTALQAVRDHGKVARGQRVLINGASGGVGTFSVQISKAFGAEVTGVCSGRNVELIQNIGADRVIDYKTTDFTRTGPYDVVIDNVGNRRLATMEDLLVRRGTLVLVGGHITRKLRARLVGRFANHRLEPFIAHVDKASLVSLKELVDTGKIRPVIDQVFPLSEAPQAIRYVETGHARAKVVVAVSV